MAGLITLTTDFGLRDPFVGIMKGVILSINPAVRLVDLTHQVESFDVVEGALALAQSYSHFPPETIHVVVVDPGVGSERRPILVSTPTNHFVGPDNGIFSLVYDRERSFAVRHITASRYFVQPVSQTFHGRDIFAPAAAHLSRGLGPAEFGPALAEPVLLPAVFPTCSGDTMEGEIVRFDRFGNGISNISLAAFKAFTGGASFLVELCGLAFPALSRSYYEDRHTCLVGSSGYLEFGLFEGNLAEEISLRKGEKVRVSRV